MIRIAIIAAILSALLSAFGAWSLTSSRWEAKYDELKLQHASERLKAQTEAATKREALAAKMLELSESLREVKATEVIKWKTIKQEVERVVEKPVYRECRVDDDGVRIYNAAAAGMRVERTSTPPPVVSQDPPAAEVRRDDGRPVASSGNGLRTIPRVPDRPR